MTHILDREGIDDVGRPWRAEYLQGSEVPQWLVVVDERILGTVVGGRGSDDAFRDAVLRLIREKLPH
jgi:hypothetical protein